ncbi:glycerate kinase [candidate division KSB1 bacterium]|nr:glycerate kinase [candidate division KSB1 bacterium]
MSRKIEKPDNFSNPSIVARIFISLQPMRILIAPAPYKECLDARTVAEIIEFGITQVLPDVQIQKLPLCDGGTGIVERFIEAKGGNKVRCRVHDSLMNEIESYFGLLNDGSAVIESAKAAGLALVPRDKRNPLVTSTYGVGDLIREAIKHGCRNILVGCGDSATNDGGVGMAKSLGFRFYDSFGEEIGEGGGELYKLARIDSTGLSVDLKNVQITVACNLTSILCGESGTTRRYAKQKGATPEMIEHLSKCMEHYADILGEYVGWDIRYMPGTGAAGGLGAGLLAYTGAKLRYSMELVCEALNVESYLKETELVITGEGMVDASSATGKAACAICLLAKKYNLPTVAIVGSIGDDADIVYFHGMDMIECCMKQPTSITEALEIDSAKIRLLDATIRVARSIKRYPMISA